jgi:uncharacterized protein YukE
MTGFSMNTEQLSAMAKELQREAGEFKDKTAPKVHKLSIPTYEFPLFALSFASSYQQMQEGADDAVGALQQTVDSMGAALGRVAAYYQQMETQQGQDFDTGGEKASGVIINRKEQPHGR